jgi:spermidine synthase
VLGGGDGLAVREILRHANIEQVTLVDLDPAMTDLFSRNAELAALNAGALSDPRVTVINADAGQWLETNAEVFDLIIADFPDPPASASASSTRCRSTG